MLYSECVKYSLYLAFNEDGQVENCSHYSFSSALGSEVSNNPLSPHLVGLWKELLFPCAVKSVIRAVVSVCHDKTLSSTLLSGLNGRAFELEREILF